MNKNEVIELKSGKSLSTQKQKLKNKKTKK